MKSDTSVIFLVGHPRSGTTMLAAALGRHESIAATPETLYFCGLSKKIDGLIRCRADIKKIASACSENKRFHDLQISESQILELLKDVEPKSAAHIFEIFLKYYATSKNKSIVLEKSPAHLLHLEQIAGHYPKAKFILLIRDGRDCIASLMKVPWSHRSVARHAAEWRHRIGHLRKMQAVLGSRVYAVRYEDIVAQPGKELMSISKFLGVTYQDIMLGDQDATESVSTTVPSWELQWKGNASLAIGTRSIESSSRQFTTRQLAVMSAIMETELKNSSYKVTKTVELNLIDAILVRTIFSEKVYIVYRQLFFGAAKLKFSLNKLRSIAKCQ